VREETQNEETTCLLKYIKNIKYKLRIHSFQIPFQVLFSLPNLARKLYSKRKLQFYKFLGVFFFWFGGEGWVGYLSKDHEAT